MTAPDFHITPIIREGRAVDFDVIHEPAPALALRSTLPSCAAHSLRTSNPPAGPEAFHNTRKLRVLSLFAGIGGFDLGLERTGGFVTVAVAELDTYASRVLSLRFPDAPNVGDVTTAEYPDADVICAGFPCQDLSYAGAGAGLAGARSGLFWEVVRAARVVRPRVIILENVAALLGRGLDVVLRALAEIGYDAEWHCIPASAIGAPHRRDRIWIVAYARGDEHEGDRAPISGALAAELSRALADAAPVFGEAVERSEPDGDHAGTGEVADATRELWNRSGATWLGRDEPADGSQALADPAGVGQSGPREPVESGSAEAHGEGQAAHALAGRIGEVWSTEPDVGRVAHGVPSRVDRLRCLGNAVVPQIPELIGHAILQSFHNTNDHLADALCSEGSGFGRLHGQLNSAGEAHDHA